MAAPVVIKTSARHSATVLFLHGLGDTGHGWAGIFDTIKASHIKYIFPTAPVAPVTLNAGFPMPSWFDIKGLQAGAEQDEPGIKAAAKTVHSWIEKEIEAGISSDRILLGGFSQGGSLAAYSTLTYEKPLAGFVGLSMWMPLAGNLPAEMYNTSIPMLQCHGEQDPMVSPGIGRMTADFIKSINPDNHVFKTYPGVAHSSSDQVF